MDNLLIKNSNMGKGVFSNKTWVKGEILLEFKGDKINSDFIPKNNYVDHYLQIGKGKYLGPSGDIDDFVNHSCEPNTGVIFEGSRIFLKVIKDINIGDEIFFDYSTTVNEDDWSMECSCKSLNCRKIIADFKYLPSYIKHKYIELNIVPEYAMEKLTIIQNTK
jgi:uncharacterized protein